MRVIGPPTVLPFPEKQHHGAVVASEVVAASAPPVDTPASAVPTHQSSQDVERNKKLARALAVGNKDNKGKLKKGFGIKKGNTVSPLDM